jgi:flagellar biosynthesis protein FlhF
MPPAAILDAYDAGGAISPADALAESPLLAPLLEQSAPFSAQLADATRRFASASAAAPADVQDASGNARADRPQPAFAPLLRDAVPAPRVVAPEWALPDPGRARARHASRPGLADRALATLAEAGFPGGLAHELIDEAERHVRPFTDGVPFDVLLRQTLARRIPVEYGWTSDARRVALVGAPGAGKTTVAAKLCRAYAAAPDGVAAMSIAGGADAERLTALLAGAPVQVDSARTPLEVVRASRRLAGCPLVVVDAPGVSPYDAEALRDLADCLEAFAPDEVHLVVPTTAAAMSVASLAEALGGASAPSRILVSRLDEQGPLGGAIGVAIARCLPVSYVSSGRDAGAGLRPAGAAELAELALRDGWDESEG